MKVDVKKIQADQVTQQICKCGCKQIQIVCYQEGRPLAVFAFPDAKGASEFAMDLSRLSLVAHGTTPEMVAQFEAETDDQNRAMVNSFLKRKVSN